MPLALRAGAVAPLGTVDVDHLNVGCVAKALPNWSKPWATSDWLDRRHLQRRGSSSRSTLLGVLTLMLVKVGVTVTVWLLVTDRPLGSTIFTLTPYVPALVKAKAVFAAALVPLALNVAVPPPGSLVIDQS